MAKPAWILIHPELYAGNAGLMAWWVLVWAIVIVVALGITIYHRRKDR